MSDVTFNGAVHPVADAYPYLSDAEMELLAADIKTNGLREPIVLAEDGTLVDGRNRLRACEIAKVTPTFVTTMVKPEDFILSANLMRRHLSPGQRVAMLALALHSKGYRQRNGRWKKGSVLAALASAEVDGNLSSWQARIREAGQVLDHDPDLLHEVARGEVSLDRTIRLVQMKGEVSEKRRLFDDVLTALDANTAAFLTGYVGDREIPADYDDVFRCSVQLDEALRVAKESLEAQAAAEQADADVPDSDGSVEMSDEDRRFVDRLQDVKVLRRWHNMVHVEDWLLDLDHIAATVNPGDEGEPLEPPTEDEVSSARMLARRMREVANAVTLWAVTTSSEAGDAS